MLMNAMQKAAAPGALERSVLMSARKQAAAPGALERNVRMNAADQFVVPGASETNAHLVALPMKIAVNLQCILQRHQEGQPNNKWA